MQALSGNEHLPVPDADSLAHSKKVANFIRDRIDCAGGSIAFSEYMQHALYAPGLGYYAAGTTKFGSAGDFVTAPGLSPVFGRILARRIAVVLAQVKTGQRSILEIGAGGGELAATMLTALRAAGALPNYYYILEVSADLQERQLRYLQSSIPDLLEKVIWLDSLPDEFSGVIVANELLDALPVERFSKRNGETCRLSVSYTTDGFVWLSTPAPERLHLAVRKIESGLGRQLPDGYSSEISLATSAWLQDLANCLQNGLVFLFDYGVSQSEYFATDRFDGWIRCHFRHHAHSDPLVYAGIQDLTSWVNFSLVAEAAADSGFRVEGYVTQGQFLMEGGLLDEMQSFPSLSTAAQLELTSQIKVLTMPGDMGDNVKCIGLSKGQFTGLDCLKKADRAHTL